MDCSVTIPALLIAGANAYVLWNEHWAHWEHMEPLEERPEYPYQNLRTKNFFWGDGDKVSRGQICELEALLTSITDFVVSFLGRMGEICRTAKKKIVGR